MASAGVPGSSGPLVRLADLQIAAPSVALTGTLVQIRGTVRIRSDGARMITTPATSALLVVAGDRVVARAGGSARSATVPLILRAGATAPAQALPPSVRLAGDDGTPLPPGDYLLVAVLGYRNDWFNSAADTGLTPPTGARDFALVSEPAPIAVRAR